MHWEQAVTNLGNQVPMKRPGQAAELATAYVMLADPLSSYAAYCEQGHDAFDSSRTQGFGPSYAGFWVTRRSGGVVCRHFDDLDAVFKSDT